MHQLAKFLIRQGRHRPKGAGLLSTKYLAWVRIQQFEQPAHREVLTHYLLEFEHSTQRLQELNKTLDDVCEQLPKPTGALVAALQALRGVAKLLAVSLVSELRGVAKLLAVSLVSELGSLCRFRTPRQLMSYAGVVSREHSSGGKIRRGAITKSGNAHIRRMMVEAAWHYRHRPGLRHGLGKRSSRPERGSQKDRVEGAVTTHTAIPAVGSAQAQASGSCSGRPGIARLHLGYRDAGGNGIEAGPGYTTFCRNKSPSTSISVATKSTIENNS
jgi:Transposase IS116/IS110/IS902 family